MTDKQPSKDYPEISLDLSQQVKALVDFLQYMEQKRKDRFNDLFGITKDKLGDPKPRSI